MSGKITFFSQNCRVLANPLKRRAIYRHVRAKKYNIVYSQDVHIQSQQESYSKGEWGYDAYCRCFNSSNRGVLILLNNNFEHKAEKVNSHPNEII